MCMCKLLASILGVAILSLYKLLATQASTLDDSLSNISKLESVAEGGGKSAVASKEQNEGREKLQVRDTT